MTCTYDDSCSLLVNTGQQIVDSENGLLSTVAMQLGPNAKPVYALEGIVANAGSAISWLRDNLAINTELLSNSGIGEDLLGTTASSSMLLGGDAGVSSGYGGIGSGGGCFINGAGASRYDYTTATTVESVAQTDVIFVPAFNGLYSPFWKHDSRGYVCNQSADICIW